MGSRGKAVVGVRPHKVRVGAGPFSAKLVSNQWLGDQAHVAMEVAGKLMVGVSSSRVRTAMAGALAYDLMATDLHLFDAENGVALLHGLDG